jgi:hypothetical protein
MGGGFDWQKEAFAPGGGEGYDPGPLRGWDQERPRRFRWRTRDAATPTGRAADWNYGCYFPATALFVTDMGERRTGVGEAERWPGFEWLDGAGG